LERVLVIGGSVTNDRSAHATILPPEQFPDGSSIVSA
jgi:hypothetical protein